MASASEYYRLTKPGIIYGNSLHFIAGIFVAAVATWDLTAAVGGLVGLMLVIGSACVINNYFDRDIDRRMSRTQKRASVTGTIVISRGLIFAGVLGIGGFSILAITTNTLTVVLGIVAYISYSFIYTLSKRYTMHHTLIGTIPGALPAVAGYTALSGSMDVIAWALFALVVFWQLPHFYAIGLYRRGEYDAAHVPLLTERYNESILRWLIVCLVAMYVVCAVFFSRIGLSLAGGILLTGGAIWWFIHSILTWNRPMKYWARRVFFDSLIITILLPVATGLNLVYRMFF